MTIHATLAAADGHTPLIAATRNMAVAALRLVSWNAKEPGPQLPRLTMAYARIPARAPTHPKAVITAISVMACSEQGRGASERRGLVGRGGSRGAEMPSAASVACGCARQ
ncbi:hypothetical protein Xcel_0042 [Xylanimonas cellulosilytica DSM 15894]|uniref:Uncharacterized protein n=1 Tax=Xylanimonas cellulosilytica (strain DSM 15894 / JCM 12276 / CECT 5975 / KCTC 9989 / LMG 20990 / NBRC 107835 / XIL07) TaxID=446471 RepID=D1BTE1_XYLCX|nr:hypothetical protein Xcel_0042 [Xylanimonas cellulosilytica DSM 15894]